MLCRSIIICIIKHNTSNTSNTNDDAISIAILLPVHSTNQQNLQFNNYMAPCTQPSKNRLTILSFRCPFELSIYV